MATILVFHSLLFVNIQEKNLHFAPYSLSILLASSLFFYAQLPAFSPQNPTF